MSAAKRKLKRQAAQLTGLPPDLTPHQLRKFLNDPTARRLLGPAEAQRLLIAAEKELRRLLATAPSQSWIDAADYRGEQCPPEPDPARLHGVVMQRSKVSGRYTPPPALESEDLLDALSEDEAAYYSFPLSPSARVMEQIRERHAKYQPSRLTYHRK